MDAVTDERRGWRRWAVAVSAPVLCASLATGLVAADRREVAPPPSLLLDGVVLESRDGVGVVSAVAPGAALAYAPRSRVADDDAAGARLAREQSRWLRAGRVPGSGSWEDMVSGALLDIHTLTGATFSSGTVSADGAVVAGWIPSWRLVWPRDASFAAVALARTGHVDDAVAVLAFLQDQQRADGSFAARYLPVGGAVADGRDDQLDAAGYVLWAAHLVVDEDTTGDAQSRLGPLIARATALLMGVTDGPDPLPAPSSDSWEVPEDRLTLGTAAATLMGLEAAAALAGDGDPAAIAMRRDALRSRIVAEFGVVGYQRYANPAGSLTAAGRQGTDANVALLLPPFQPEALPGAEQAWLRSFGPLREPAGGLSPGEGWRNDGVSWTPQTTLYAWVAAENGMAGIATDLLDWTAEHRTSSGAIPEKVAAGGEPRSVAPLTWSSANVVLAASALEVRPQHDGDRVGGAPQLHERVDAQFRADRLRGRQEVRVLVEHGGHGRLGGGVVAGGDSRETGCREGVGGARRDARNPRPVQHHHGRVEVDGCGGWLRRRGGGLGGLGARGGLRGGGGRVR